MILATICVSAALSACAHHQAPPPGTLVVPCKAPAVAQPDYPFDSLKPGADIHTQTKTLLADREVRKDETGQLRAALRSCS